MARRTKITGAVALVFAVTLLAIFFASSHAVVSLTFIGLTNNASGFTNAPFIFRYDVTNEPFSFALLRLNNHSKRPVDFAPMAVTVPQGSDWIGWSVGKPGNQSYKQYVRTSGRGFPSLREEESLTFPVMTPVGTNAWRFTVQLPAPQSRLKVLCYAVASRIGIDIHPRYRILTLTAPAMTITESMSED